ncbi:hypothetical protein [Nonlabens xiamenensis]|uniref:hypothetical protein n=1 Tax=Nonlabens xiamenensis TaxID=2341043 RepID=UPI000F613FD1|nr:hypothetical protein [Nonlabens xiamenensis]
MKDLWVYSVVQRFFLFAFQLLVLFAFAKAKAQQPPVQSSELQINAATFSVVDIQLEEYLHLEITTHKQAQVKVNTFQTGEYHNSVVLNPRIIADTLKFSDPQSPEFNYPQDKLSAHKVVDGKARIYIPEGKKLVINARPADIDITGIYTSIYVNQQSGSCLIREIQGDLTYVSVYANLKAILKNYDIMASSKTGETQVPAPVRLVRHVARLESIQGNISVFSKPE